MGGGGGGSIPTSCHPNTPHAEVVQRQDGLISERNRTRLGSVYTPICLNKVCSIKNKSKFGRFLCGLSAAVL